MANLYGTGAGGTLTAGDVVISKRYITGDTKQQLLPADGNTFDGDTYTDLTAAIPFTPPSSIVPTRSVNKSLTAGLYDIEIYNRVEDELGNTDVVYIGGRSASGSSACRLYKSTDGGESWTLAWESPTQSAVHLMLGAGASVSGQYVVLAYYDTSPSAITTFYISDDYGATFSAGPTLSGSNVYTISVCVDEANDLVTTISASSSIGEKVSFKLSNPTGTLYRESRGNVGAAGGDFNRVTGTHIHFEDGKALRTTDGTTWTEQAVTSTWGCWVDWLEGNRWVAYDSIGGIVLYSDDDGLTWNASTLIGDAIDTSVKTVGGYFNQSVKASLAVNQSGQLMTSTDYGETIAVQQLQDTANLRMLSKLPNETMFMIGGANGSLYHKEYSIAYSGHGYTVPDYSAAAEDYKVVATNDALTLSVGDVIVTNQDVLDMTKQKLLLCDGSALDASAYPELDAVLVASVNMSAVPSDTHAAVDPPPTISGSDVVYSSSQRGVVFTQDMKPLVDAGTDWVIEFKCTSHTTGNSWFYGLLPQNNDYSSGMPCRLWHGNSASVIQTGLSGVVEGDLTADPMAVGQTYAVAYDGTKNEFRLYHNGRLAVTYPNTWPQTNIYVAFQDDTTADSFTITDSSTLSHAYGFGKSVPDYSSDPWPKRMVATAGVWIPPVWAWESTYDPSTMMENNSAFGGFSEGLTNFTSNDSGSAAAGLHGLPKSEGGVHLVEFTTSHVDGNVTKSGLILTVADEPNYWGEDTTTFYNMWSAPHHHTSNGGIYYTNTSISKAHVPWGTTAVVALKFDLDADTCTFYVDNVEQYTFPLAEFGDTLYVSLGDWSNLVRITNAKVRVNESGHGYTYGIL